MSDVKLGNLAQDGLWKNNPALVQILGLCPLLAISNTTINAMGLALATLATVLLSNILVSLIRHWVRPEVRLPVFVLVIASVVTTIELIMNAFFHELFLVLGIFIPLIVTNCFIIARAESFASRHRVSLAAWDGLMMGLGFGLVLIVMGAMRELVGFGTLLANAEQLFGAVAHGWTIRVLPEDTGFLLAILPPGAFMALALLIALKQTIDRRLKERAAARVQLSAATEQPART